MRIVVSMIAPVLIANLLSFISLPASAQEQTFTESITCVSTNRQRVECPVDGLINGVRQTSAFAGAFCIQGFSWGYDQKKIWVDIGCSGSFDVDFTRPIVAEQRPNVETFVQSVDCRSVGSQRQECKVEGRIQDVEPVGSFSSVPCRYGTSWGFKKRHIWVDRGCEARFNVTYTQRVNRPEPTPEPVVTPEAPPSETPQNGLASAPLAAIVAQGACTGLYPSLSTGGYVFSVPRQCSKGAPDCKAVCENLRKTVDNRRFRRTLKKRNLSCFNSIHVYDKAPAISLGAAGTQTYVYNSCRGGCGPNYCCCSAE